MVFFGLDDVVAWVLRQPENDNGAAQESRYSFSGCLC